MLGYLNNYLKFFIESGLIQYRFQFFSIFLFGLLLIIVYLFLNFVLSKAFLLFSQRAVILKFQQKRVDTIIKAIRLFFKFFFIFIFIIFSLQQFKINLNTVLASASVLGTVLVLILQNVLRDIFTGWMFVFEDTFRKDEEVIINNAFRGKVVDFTYRYLILESQNNSKIYIPFSQISFIENLSRPQ